MTFYLEGSLAVVWCIFIHCTLCFNTECTYSMTQDSQRITSIFFKREHNRSCSILDFFCLIGNPYKSRRELHHCSYLFVCVNLWLYSAKQTGQRSNKVGLCIHLLAKNQTTRIHWTDDPLQVTFGMLLSIKFNWNKSVGIYNQVHNFPINSVQKLSLVQLTIYVQIQSCGEASKSHQTT